MNKKSQSGMLGQCKVTDTQEKYGRVTPEKNYSYIFNSCNKTKSVRMMKTRVEVDETFI